MTGYVDPRRPNRLIFDPPVLIPPSSLEEFEARYEQRLIPFWRQNAYLEDGWFTNQIGFSLCPLTWPFALFSALFPLAMRERGAKTEESAS